MVTSPDRRVRRTRHALRGALLDLIAEKGYDAVTVQDVIDRADVGRSTFYNHYTSKDDLMHDGLADLRTLMEPPSGARPAGQRLRFSRPFLLHIHEQQQLAHAIFTERGHTPLLRQIEQLLAEAVRAELPAVSGRIPQEALVLFVAGSLIALLEWWVTSNIPISPEEIDDIFQTLAWPAIHAAAGHRASQSTP